MKFPITSSIDILSEPEIGQSVIEIKDLVKTFGEQEVLKNVSLKLCSGENLVILGKSGSGKSVLIKCIVGLLKADSGTIDVYGQNVPDLNWTELNELRKKMGFLFQSGALYDSMTVKQNLLFSLRRIKKKLSEKEMAEKVNEVLENVGLVDTLDKMPSQLSGGMRKRVSLARTLILDPGIMLYDEPTTGLDPVTSEGIGTLINEVQVKYKTSSIIITHDIRCARQVANRIIMIDEGRIYSEGKIEDFENSTDPMIQSFFSPGDSRSNK